MNDNLRDTPRLPATDDETRYALTIEDVAHRYVEAGHPRTIRTLQRYCASGHLDCLKQPTTLGDMYRITPASVARHLAQLEELARATVDANNRAWSRQDAAEVVPENNPDANATNLAANGDASRPVAAEAAMMSRYVERVENENAFLRTQIETKDEQIKDLTERSRETNVLIGGLQRMLSPLLKSPDPFPRDEEGRGGVDRPIV
jgi:hypothetical protein